MSSLTTIISSAAAGRMRYQIFKNNGIWTKPAGISVVEVLIVGGGGGGGGAGPTLLSTNATVTPSAVNKITVGGGGGGGQVRQSIIEVSSNVQVSIGPGGFGGFGGVSGTYSYGYGVWPDGAQGYPAVGNGNNGTDTKFGDFIALGGGGGSGSERYSLNVGNQYGSLGGGGESKDDSLYGAIHSQVSASGSNFAETGYGFPGGGGLVVVDKTYNHYGITERYRIGINGAGNGGLLYNYGKSIGEDGNLATGGGGGGAAYWGNAQMPSTPEYRVYGGTGGGGICVVKWWDIDR